MLGGVFWEGNWNCCDSNGGGGGLDVSRMSLEEGRRMNRSGRIKLKATMSYLAR
jgi:hypothetical protein